MPSPTFDRDRAAAVLVDAQLMGDERAREKWKLSERTFYRYRTRLDTDPDLAELVREKKLALDAVFRPEAEASVIDVAASCLAFLARAASEGDPTNPEMVHAVMGGYKLVRELEMRERALEVYLDGLRVQHGRPLARPTLEASSPSHPARA